MSEPITNLEDAVAALGALPMPVGSAPEAETGSKVAELIGDAKPASDALLIQLGQSVRDRLAHEHPKWEDLFCLNLTSYMGERMGPVLRRLVDAEARIATLEAAPTVTYRAEHPDAGITLGTYATRDAARAHCEAFASRENPVAALEWRPDGEWREDDDGEPGPDESEELFEYGTHETSTWDPTGYVVTPVEIASEYDAEADE